MLDALLTPGPPAVPASSESRTVLVSNRLPCTVGNDGGVPRLQPSSGGLAAALRSVHAASSTLWIGWAGPTTSAGVSRALEQAFQAARLVPVVLDAAEVDGYYRRFANGVLWPALHALPLPERADLESWRAYAAVNARFAAAAARQLRSGDELWIHDYHLLLVPGLVRRMVPGARIGFFLHTPFALGDDVLDALVRQSLLDGLRAADVIGVQTRGDAEALARALAHARGGSHAADRRCSRGPGPRIGVVPIGAEVADFAAVAAQPSAAAIAGEYRAGGTPLFVGVDRLDYTKGIPHRLRAFEHLLAGDPTLASRARLVQVAVPSRDGASGYAELRAEVEALVEHINARFPRRGGPAVEYVYGTVDRARLAGLYRAADVMLVTPLRDGMNLVAKEFVASRLDGDGALVLGSGAGAAAELWPAIVVDASDEAALTRALHRAVRMPERERRERMVRLRAIVSENDVHRWNETLLQSLRTPRILRTA